MDTFLQQFWEQESVPGDQSALSPADQRAMQLISDTTVRDEEGRYYVVHPKKDPVPILGESRHNAVRRYHQNEKSLTKKRTWLNFHESVGEYVLLNHAELVPPADLKKPPNDSYYLPMHGVFKRLPLPLSSEWCLMPQPRVPMGCPLMTFWSLGPLYIHCCLQLSTYFDSL